MTRPNPVAVMMCDTCDRPWSEHEKSARNRARAAEDPYEPVKKVKVKITRLDCIQALKNANRGPMGYTGPQGAMGDPGRRI